VLQRARHVRGQRQHLDAHQELVGAALDRDGARRVPRQLERCQQRRDISHALVHDGTQLRELPERPVAVQHEAKRARVCQVQERQRIVLRRLQRVRKAAECAPGQLPFEAEQRQCRVACVEPLGWYNAWAQGTRTGRSRGTSEHVSEKDAATRVACFTEY